MGERASRTADVAAIGAAVALGYAGFQAALALGVPAGRYAWGGSHRVLPAGLRVASAVAAPIYVVLAAALSSARVAPPSPRRRRALRVAAAFFVVGVPLNLASPSRAERPHALGAAILAAACIAAARSADSSGQRSPGRSDEVTHRSRLRS